jgi:hypothetical protein
MIGSIGATGGIVSPIFSRWMKDLKGIARIASKRWRKVLNTFMQTIVQH